MGRILGALAGIGLSLGIAATILDQRRPLVEHMDITNDGRKDIVFRDRQGIELSCLVQQPDGRFHPTGVHFNGYLGTVCETPEGFYDPANQGVFLRYDLTNISHYKKAPHHGPYFISAGGIGGAF